jgi:hypothetical protein
MRNAWITVFGVTTGWPSHNPVDDTSIHKLRDSRLRFRWIHKL